MTAVLANTSPSPALAPVLEEVTGGTTEKRRFRILKADTRQRVEQKYRRRPVAGYRPSFLA